MRAGTKRDKLLAARVQVLMLAGERVTEAARAAADELLEGAGGG
jgi:hypothetical protein